jgi:CheY-like chemotaxis protein
VLGLIVDPDPDTRLLYGATLAPIVDDVAYAGDGAEGIAIAIHRLPKLVITESLLPRIDGYTFCRLLREEPATRDAVVLMVTAQAMPDELARARSCGADSVLVKPCLPDTLLAEAQRLREWSTELRARSEIIRARIPGQLAKAGAALDLAMQKRHVLARAHVRQRTTIPPLPPPELRCPGCDRTLVYRYSHTGGVSARHPEQWDYYECATCGLMQYRHRTRRLRLA